MRLLPCQVGQPKSQQAFIERIRANNQKASFSYVTTATRIRATPPQRQIELKLCAINEPAISIN